MTIQLYSIRIKRLYLFIALLAPIWIVIPVVIQYFGGNQYAVIFLGLILLTITLILAQIFARKPIDLTVQNNIISFDEIEIHKDQILDIEINKSGIGMSAIEFNLITEEKITLHLPNLKENAEDGIAFVKKQLPEVKFIAPIDLLED